MADEYQYAFEWWLIMKSKKDRIEFVYSLLDDPMANHDIGNRLARYELHRK